MPSIVDPEVRFRQPNGYTGINWGHRLAAGLYSVLSPTNQAFDVGAGKLQTPAGASGVASIGAINGRHLSWKFVNTGSEKQRVGVVAPSGGFGLAAGFKYSMFVLARSTTVNDQSVLCNVNYDGTTVPISLCMGNNATVGGLAYFQGSWVKTGVVNDPTGDGKWHTVAGTINNSTTNLRFYMDGVLNASTTSSNTSAHANTNTLDWGCYQNNNVGINGEIALGFLWIGRELTPADIASLSSNPWQLFQNVSRPPLIGPSASANRTMTAVLGTETLTSLVPVFNQAESIVAPLGTETLTGLVPTFVQPVVLTAPLGTETLTGLVPTITQGNTLASALGTETLTGLVPVFNQTEGVVAPLGTETLTGLVPTFVQSGSGNQAITAVLGTETLTGLVPVFNQAESIVAPLGIGTLTGLVPTFVQPVVMTAALGTATLTSLVPVFNQTQGMVADIGIATLGGLVPQFSGVVYAPAVTGGGYGKPQRGRGGKHRRIYVRIDDEEFEVGSDEEAADLLAQAQEHAEATAKGASEKAIQKAKPKVPEVPRIELVRDEQAPTLLIQQFQAQIEATQARIADTYRRAWADAIAERQAADDRDVEEILMLHDKEEKRMVGELVKLLGKRIKRG